MKFGFQGGCLLPQNHFVSEIQDCVWEVSQRKIGLTNSHIVHVKKMIFVDSQLPHCIWHQNDFK